MEYLFYWDTHLVGGQCEHGTLQILDMERVLVGVDVILETKQRGCKCVEVYYVHWVSQVQCLCSVCEQHVVYINEHLC